VETGGEITLPAKLLNDIVTSSRGHPRMRNLSVPITSASGRYQVRGMGAEEFPELPVVEKEADHLPAEALIEGHGSCH